MLLLASAAFGQTAFYYKSLAGDFIGQGATVVGRTPDWTFLASHVNGQSVHISMNGPAGAFQTLDFAAYGGTLAAGAYEEAARDPFNGTSPGVAFGGNGRGCNQLHGRFVVLESDFGPNATINRFAANFEQWCDNSSAPLYGEIRINSAIPLNADVTAPDTSPDPFAFVVQNPVQAGSTVDSNSITVYGVNAAVPVSVTGGTYSMNGAAFTSAPGSAQQFDHIVVRTTAPLGGGQSGQATLQVGNQSATLSVTTYLAGTPLTGIYYNSPAGEYVGQGKTRLHLTPMNQITVQRNAGNGVSFALNGVGGTHFTLDLAAPGNATILPGTYSAATRYPFQVPAAPGLDFSGDGRGCNQSNGQFVVREAAYNPDGSVASFAADFQQLCDANPNLLTGEVRYNSTVPFSALEGASCAAGNDSDGDGIPDCIETSLGLNAAVKDNDVFGNARLFTMQQYRDFVGREGDGAGVDFWSGQIASAAITRADLVEQFMSSPEFDATSAAIARLYFAYFTRVPDYDGLNHWIAYAQAGNSLESISELFAQSPEFIGKYGQLSPRDFVIRVYLNVLGRAPDADGLFHWYALLGTRELTRGQVMVAFSESTEFRALSHNEIVVTFAYARMLRRTPDAGGFGSWLSYLDAGNSPAALINQVIASPEYHSRFLP